MILEEQIQQVTNPEFNIPSAEHLHREQMSVSALLCALGEKPVIKALLL